MAGEEEKDSTVDDKVLSSMGCDCTPAGVTNDGTTNRNLGANNLIRIPKFVNKIVDPPNGRKILLIFARHSTFWEINKKICF